MFQRIHTDNPGAISAGDPSSYPPTRGPPSALKLIGTIHLDGMRVTAYYLARRTESVLVKARTRETGRAAEREREGEREREREKERGGLVGLKGIVEDARR